MASVLAGLVGDVTTASERLAGVVDMPSVKWILLVVAGFLCWPYLIDRGYADPVDEMLDVTVSVLAVSPITIDQVGDSTWTMGSGSGVFVAKHNCEVWTNYHVVQDAAWIEVLFSGYQEPVPAKLVNYDPLVDVAILEMQECSKIPHAARIGDSDELRVGDRVYATGNPLGSNPDSMTGGIVSHLGRFKAGGPIPYIQTDAAISQGSSGGALFNERGQLVGVNVAVSATQKGIHTGIGYAIPANVVMDTVERLRNSPPTKGVLNLEGMMSDLSPSEAQMFGVPGGVLLADEQHVFGFKRHDIIVSAEGRKIANRAELEGVAASHSPGDSIDITVVRGGRPIQLRALISDGLEVAPHIEPDGYDGLLGMEFETVALFGGPVITAVKNLGPAHRAKIQSSQNDLYRYGDGIVVVQLDIKSVTGVFYRGTYQAISTVHDLEQIAERAHNDGGPLLLEIEHWVKSDPTEPFADFKHDDTKYFLLTPKNSVVNRGCSQDQGCLSTAAVGN